MKKEKKNRRILFILVGLALVSMLIIAVAAASAFAYWKLSGGGAVLVAFPNREARDEARSVVYVDRDTGVEVTAVDPEGPAFDAGLKPGTLILAVNGQDVSNSSELVHEINRYAAGDKITLTVEERGRVRDIVVRLESAGPYLGVNIGSQVEHSERFNFDMDVLPRLRDFPRLEGHLEIPAVPAEPSMPRSTQPYEFFGDLDEFDWSAPYREFEERFEFAYPQDFDGFERSMSGVMVLNEVATEVP